jgi:hypothetical protein
MCNKFGNRLKIDENPVRFLFFTPTTNNLQVSAMHYMVNNVAWSVAPDDERAPA